MAAAPIADIAKTSMNAAVPSGRRHLAGLDGLRGVAAMAVVVGHVAEEDGLPQLYQYGLAVDFFFMLSGFVIAHAYAERIRDGRMNFWQFLRLRVVRLHPLLLLAMTISLAYRLIHLLAVHLGVQGLGPAPGLATLAGLTVTGILCLPWHPATEFSDLFPLDGPQWSLYVEYVLSIAFAVVIRRVGWAGLVLSIGIGLAALAGIVIIHGDLDVGPGLHDALLAVGRGLFPFAVGVALNRLDRGQRLPKLSAPWWILALTLVLALAAPVEKGVWIYQLLVVIVPWPLLIIFGRQDRFPPSWRRALLWSGAISYPLYILHVPLMHIFSKFARAHGTILQVATFGLQILLVVVMAQLALRFFDEPVRRWLTGRVGGRRVTPDA